MFRKLHFLETIVALAILSLAFADHLFADPINVGDDPDIPDDCTHAAVSTKWGSQDAMLDYDGDLVYSNSLSVGTLIGDGTLDTSVLGSGTGTVKSTTRVVRHSPSQTETLGMSCQSLKPLKITSQTLPCGATANMSLDIHFDGLLVVYEELGGDAYSTARVEYLAEIQQYDADLSERVIYDGNSFDGVMWVTDTGTAVTTTVPEQYDWGAGDGLQPNSWYNNAGLTLVEITAENIDTYLTGDQKDTAQSHLDDGKTVYYLIYEETFTFDVTVGETYYMNMDLLSAAGCLNAGLSTASSFALADFSNTIDYTASAADTDLLTLVKIDSTQEVSEDNQFGGASSITTLSGATLTWAGAYDLATSLELGGAADSTLNTNGNNVALSGVISGSQGAVKSGAGELQLAGNNTFTGGLEVTGGDLEVAHEEALGTGSLNMNSAGSTLQLNTDDAAGSADARANIDNNIAASANFIMNVAQDTELSGVISGGSSITRTGSSGLELSGNSAAFTGTVGLNAGTTELSGTLGNAGVGNVNVNNGATLTGSGTIGGALNIAAGGTLSPGSSPGTTYVGTFNLADGSTLNVEIESTTSFDIVDVTNTATIGDTATIAVTGFNSPFIDDGDKFAIIQTGGGVTVNGDGPDITDDIALVSFITDDDVTDGNYELLAQRTEYNSIPGISLNANQSAVGDGLDALGRGNPNSAGLALLASMDTLGQAMIDGGASTAEIAAYRAALDNLSPERYDILARVQRRNVQVFSNVLGNYLQDRRSGLWVGSSSDNGQRRLATMPTSIISNPTLLAKAIDVADAPCDEGSSNPWGGFVRGIGSLFDDDDKSDRTGFSAVRGGVQGGIDYRVNPRLLVGLAVGESFVNVDYGSPGGDADIRVFRIGPYLGYTLTDNLHVDAAVTYGLNNQDTKRQVTVGGTSSQAKADFKGHDLSVYSRICYEANVGRDITFTPQFTMLYSYFAQESFTESGAEGANLSVDSQNTQSFQTMLGGSLSTVWRVKDVTFVPEISMGWLHESLANGDDITAKFLGSPESFNTNRSSPDRDTFVIGTGITSLLSDTVSAYLRYDGSFNQNGDGHTASAGVCIHF